MAWPLLCTYLRGRPRNWNPFWRIRMLPRQYVVHSFIARIGCLSSAFPSALKSNYSKRDFRGLFGKCEIKSLCNCGSGFLPRYRCKNRENFITNKLFMRKNAKSPFIFSLSLKRSLFRSCWKCGNWPMIRNRERTKHICFLGNNKMRSWNNPASCV